MDPNLWELLEQGDDEDEVAAIIRVGQSGIIPPGVRIIAQFGEIITVRMKRGSILDIRETTEVSSFKAPGHPMGPEVEFDDTELLESLNGSILQSDERRPPSLNATGQGVVIGIVDWGFDFAHPDFRNPDSSTRLLALWDQRGKSHPKSPQPYGYGIVHTPEEINRALDTSNPYTTLNYDPADADIMGRGSHGTLVASIAAGNGDGGGPIGIAPEAEIVFVHMANWGDDPSAKLGNSVTLLEAIDFISRTAEGRPWVINLSMGRTGEQHDGTTLVEQGLDAAVRAAPGHVICQSTGNYFQKRLHVSGQLRPSEVRTIAWEVAESDTTPNELEIWYPGRDKMEVRVRGPNDSEVLVRLGERTSLTEAGQRVGKVYHRAAEPNNLDNHIAIYLDKGAPAGDWDVTLIATNVVDGRYHAWIERDSACPNCQSHFHRQDADPTSTTGTICNGLRTIAVGAYNAHRPDQPPAPFSSMGPTRDGRLKPDLCAPGVGILGARSRPYDDNNQAELLTRMSGTSFAAPHVTGTVALMLEVSPRPLRIEEVHNLLVANARKVTFPEELPDRVGGGYLDIERTVESARRVGSIGPELKEVVMTSEEFLSEDLESAEGRSKKESEAIEEVIAKYNFVLISGGPGPFDNRDVEHDQSWANYVTPPLLLTDTEAERKAFVSENEEVWWFVYKPAYERRWLADSSSSSEARRKAVKNVKDQGFSSYTDMLEARAKARGWNLRWLNEAGDLWKKMKTFSRHSISRVWYWGHARDDLWLSVRHDPDSGVALAPYPDEIINISDIDINLKKRFRKGSKNRMNRFIGCNTVQFAKAWSQAFGVWSAGVEGKVNFASIHKTGGEPSLVGSAVIKNFSPSGEESRETWQAEEVRIETIDEADEFAFNHESLPVSFEDIDGGGTESGTAELTELVNRVIQERLTSHSSEAIIPLIFELTETAPQVNKRFASAAEIFDSFVYSGNRLLRNQLDKSFEVVSLPRARLDEPIQPGDIIVRRGEGGFGHLSMIATPNQWSYDELATEGLVPETARSGLYMQVIEGGVHPHSLSDMLVRRVADEQGWLNYDTIILRPRYRPQEFWGITSESADEMEAITATCLFDAELPEIEEAIYIESELPTDPADGWVVPEDVLRAGEEQTVKYNDAPDWDARGANCAGRLLEGSKILRAYLLANFTGISKIGGYNCRPNSASPSKLSVHGTGRALDIMIPTISGRANSSVGDPIAGWLILNASVIGIQYLIWNRVRWSGGRRRQKFARYTGPNPHRDHIHVELNLAASERRTPWFANRATPPDPGRQTTLDYEKAVRLNRFYGRQLGWQNRNSDIGRFLGLTIDNPEMKEFIDAISRWQMRQGLTVDGIIGPNTWKKLQLAMGSANIASTPVAATGGRSDIDGDAWQDPHASERRVQLDEQPKYMYHENPTVRQYTNYSPRGAGPKKEVERVTDNGSFISRVLRIIAHDKQFEGLTGEDGLTIGIGDFAAGSDISFLFEAWRLYPTLFREIFGARTDEMMRGSPHNGWLTEHQVKRNRRWVNDHGLITIKWLRRGIARLLVDRRFYGIQLGFWVKDKVAPSFSTFREFQFELEFTLAMMCGMANSMGHGGMRKLVIEGQELAQGMNGLEREIVIIRHACNRYAHSGGTFRTSEPAYKREKASLQATAVINHVFDGETAPTDAQHRAMRIMRTNREFPLQQRITFNGNLGNFTLTEGEIAPATPNYNPPPPLPDRLTSVPQ